MRRRVWGNYHNIKGNDLTEIGLFAQEAATILAGGLTGPIAIRGLQVSQGSPASSVAVSAGWILVPDSTKTTGAVYGQLPTNATLSFSGQGVGTYLIVATVTETAVATETIQPPPPTTPSGAPNPFYQASLSPYNLDTVVRWTVTLAIRPTSYTLQNREAVVAQVFWDGATATPTQVIPNLAHALSSQLAPRLAGSGLVQSGGVLSVNADNSTLVITSNTLGIANSGVGTSQLADGAVTTAKIANGAVTETKLANNSVSSQKIIDGAVTSTKIADSAVTTPKIANNAVTWEKIDDGVVPKLRGTINFEGADWDQFTTPGFYRVTSTGGSPTASAPPAPYRWGILEVIKTLDGSIEQRYTPHQSSDPNIYIRQNWNGVSGHWSGWRIIRAPEGQYSLPNGVVTTPVIADGAVTNSKIAVNSTLIPNLNADLLDGHDSVDFARKAENATVTGSWTFSSPVTASGGVHLPNNTWIASRDATNSTIVNMFRVNTSNQIEAGAPIAGNLQGNASTASALQTARTISLGGDLSGSTSFNGTANVSIAASINTGAVTTGKIADNAVTTAKIANGAVTGAKLAPGAALENIGVLATAPSATGTALLYNGRELGIVGDATEAKWILHTGDYSLNLYSDHSNTINLGNAITLQGRTYRRKIQFTESGEILGRYNHQWRFPISIGGLFPFNTTMMANTHYSILYHRIFVPTGWSLILRRARYHIDWLHPHLRVDVYAILGSSPGPSWTSTSAVGDIAPNATLVNNSPGIEVSLNVLLFNSTSSNINISTNPFGIWLELELKPS